MTVQELIERDGEMAVIERFGDGEYQANLLTGRMRWDGSDLVGFGNTSYFDGERATLRRKLAKAGVIAPEA